MNPRGKTVSNKSVSKKSVGGTYERCTADGTSPASATMTTGRGMVNLKQLRQAPLKCGVKSNVCKYYLFY